MSVGSVSNTGEIPGMGASVPPFLEIKTCSRCVGGGFFEMPKPKSPGTTTAPLEYQTCGQCNGHGYVYRMRMVKVA